MTKRFFRFLLIFIFLVFPLQVLGADTAINKNQVTISGQTGAGQWVSLVVEREDGRKSYINQVCSDSGGRYQFQFSLDRGRYNAATSAGGVAQPFLPLEINSDLVSGGNGGGNGGSSIPQQSTAAISIRGDTQTGIILDNASWSWSGSCTALDVLKGVLNQWGISYNISGEYVKSIAGQAEKKAGYPLSGWLFRINGVFPGVGVGSAIIRNGDRVEWLYTLDGGKDIGATVLIDNKSQELIPEQINQVMNVVSQYQQSLRELKEKNLIINKGNRMSAKEVEQLRQELINNKVDISREISRECLVK